LGAAQSLRLPATSGTPSATQNVAITATLPGGAAVPTAAAFDRFDPSSFNNSTQTTIFDAEGNPRTLTNYFRRETVGTAGGTSDWSVFSFVGDQPLTVGGAASATLTFDAAGTLTAPAGPITFDTVTPTGSPNAQVIALDFGTGTAQRAQPFDISARSQDGTAVGLIQGVTVDAKGLVQASFSNGDTQTLGQVVLATFTNPAGLRQLGNSNWSVTGLSGEPVTGAAGENGFGDLLSGTIERANVDTTEELVALIAAQRNFQANAQALETDNQVIQTLFNIQ
jgi:flagellar hook protein FlgE